jgi:hypothetical protein
MNAECDLKHKVGLDPALCFKMFSVVRTFDGFCRNDGRYQHRNLEHRVRSNSGSIANSNAFDLKYPESVEITNKFLGSGEAITAEMLQTNMAERKTSDPTYCCILAVTFSSGLSPALDCRRQ